MKHRQHYYDANPKPSAKGLLWQGVKAIAYTVNAVVIVYLLTVLVFSF